MENEIAKEERNGVGMFKLVWSDKERRDGAIYLFI